MNLAESHPVSAHVYKQTKRGPRCVICGYAGPRLPIPVLTVRCEWCKGLFEWSPKRIGQMELGPKRACSADCRSSLADWEKHNQKKDGRNMDEQKENLGAQPNEDMRSVEQWRIDNWFTYHPPSEEQLVQYREVRTAAKIFAETINRHVPDGEEKRAALLNLRVTVMAANAGIACQPAEKANHEKIMQAMREWANNKDHSGSGTQGPAQVPGENVANAASEEAVQSADLWHRFTPTPKQRASASYKFLLSKFGENNIEAECDTEEAALLGEEYLNQIMGDGDELRNGETIGHGRTVQEALDSAAASWISPAQLREIRKEEDRLEAERNRRAKEFEKKCCGSGQ